ncbi:hypothetical protein SELSPUOL_02481 [Selenomonas sputigena ATCC 35185]|uniref:Uncharacterized protein n=1 Tax=Selenomonas sputigena (strain ATCC 35185 / DSM 20758 / CCUG 44933 / VPI D19B-28) TaxID=546271 RepID=C9LYC2_SELS3|nr:hypothetical protein SELSPUOL_02481 [Selenomonas sputigena ATCC 35185]
MIKFIYKSLPQSFLRKTACVPIGNTCCLTALQHFALCDYAVCRMRRLIPSALLRREAEMP